MEKELWTRMELEVKVEADVEVEKKVVGLVLIIVNH